MSTDFLQEFRDAILLDNKLLAAASAAGDLNLEDLADLSCNMRVVYRLVALETQRRNDSHSSSSTEVCDLQAMWQALYDFYGAAAQLWTPISANDDNLTRYRLQLERLRATARDRVELYRLEENPPPRY